MPVMGGLVPEDKKIIRKVDPGDAIYGSIKVIRKGNITHSSLYKSTLIEKAGEFYKDIYGKKMQEVMLDMIHNKLLLK